MAPDDEMENTSGLSVRGHDAVMVEPASGSYASRLPTDVPVAEFSYTLNAVLLMTGGSFTSSTLMVTVQVSDSGGAPVSVTFIGSTYVLLTAASRVAESTVRTPSHSPTLKGKEDALSIFHIKPCPRSGSFATSALPVTCVPTAERSATVCVDVHVLCVMTGAMFTWFTSTCTTHSPYSLSAPTRAACSVTLNPAVQRPRRSWWLPTRSVLLPVL